MSFEFEQFQRKIQTSVEAMLGRIDRSYLRSMQRSAFLCSAKCCDEKSSTESVQSCVDRCQDPIMNSQVSV